MKEVFGFLVKQLPLAIWCATIFIGGGVVGVFAVRHQVRHLTAFPLWMANTLRKYMPPDASFLRIFAVIFTFNGTMMFLYMLSGLGVILPVIIDFLTGMHIMIVMLDTSLRARMEMATAQADDDGKAVLPDIPRSRRFASALVLMLELPAFWFAIAMGITIGFAVQDQEGGQKVMALTRLATQAYVSVILPVLFLSALAEAYAIHDVIPWNSVD